jgi:Na+/melibiose symporter-like transporter
MVEHTTTPRTMEGKRMWYYASGIMGHFLPVNFLNAYIFVYFVYVVGLDALLVSIGTALGVIVNAFGAPIFGYLADNKRPGKLGKRKAFLIYGLPGLVLCIIVTWLSWRTSYFGEENFGIAAFLWIFQIAFFLNYAMIRSSYTSSLPEQSQDEKNRVKISTIQGMFSLIATIIGIVLPLVLQSIASEPKNIYDTPADVSLLQLLLPILGIGFGVIAIVFTLFAFVSIDETFIVHETESKTVSGKGSNFKDALASIVRPMLDKEYAKWLGASTSMNAGMRMIVKALAPLCTYVLLLKGSGFIVYILLLLPFAFAGFFFWSKRARNAGLKHTYCKSTFIAFVFMACTTIFVLFQLENWLTLVIAFVIIAGVLFNLVTGYLLPNPIISMLVDDSPENVKAKLGGVVSGAYFGSYLFLLNIANALGDIFIGLLLSGDNAMNPFFIAMVLPIAGFTYLVAVLVFKSSKLR